MFETDISNVWGSIEFSDLMKMEERLSQAHTTLAQGTGEGNDFLGWYHLPSHTTEDELDEIQKAANRIRRDSKALVVIGIGGSYLGARAAIEFMNGVMHNETDRVKIYFAGNHLSTRALNALQRGWKMWISPAILSPSPAPPWKLRWQPECSGGC